uniref:Uncharacterized protein n=1 Tax=Cacopsylla melanoneura TaxID=428564 RepID=A0A8D8VSH6_9HEMI
MVRNTFVIKWNKTRINYLNQQKLKKSYEINRFLAIPENTCTHNPTQELTVTGQKHCLTVLKSQLFWSSGRTESTEYRNRNTPKRNFKHKTEKSENTNRQTQNKT